MSKREKTPSRPAEPVLLANLALNSTPFCAGMGCGRAIHPVRSGIYVIHEHEAVPFCGAGCYMRTMALALEQEWANREVKQGDLLGKLGYNGPELLQAPQP